MTILHTNSCLSYLNFCIVVKYLKSANCNMNYHANEQNENVSPWQIFNPLLWYKILPTPILSNQFNFTTLDSETKFWMANLLSETIKIFNQIQVSKVSFQQNYSQWIWMKILKKIILRIELVAYMIYKDNHFNLYWSNTGTHTGCFITHLH